MIDKQMSSFNEKLREKHILKVGLHAQKFKNLPYGNLTSRPAVAIVFTYMGDREEVSDLMQKTSHETRAYFVNADGLKGFLVEYSTVIGVIKKADRVGKLQEVMKHQQVDLEVLQS